MAKKKKTGKKLPPWLKDKGGKKGKEEGEDEHDKNSASEGPHGEAMSADEYRKKGIYVTDSKHHNCKKVHPDTSHKAWEKENVKEEANESIDVKRFISEISKKNYADANKYLQAALEDKMKSRIAETQHNLGF
tara:strand:- start:40 stop:438 length:399 start_codon:yes stop_codon:yes gene_type:complete